MNLITNYICNRILLISCSCTSSSQINRSVFSNLKFCILSTPETLNQPSFFLSHHFYIISLSKIEINKGPKMLCTQTKASGANEIGY